MQRLLATILILSLLLPCMTATGPVLHPIATASAAPLGQEAPSSVDPTLKTQADRLFIEGTELLRRDPRGALDKLEQALQLYRRAGDRRGEGRTLGIIGIAHRNLSQDAEALRFFQQALAVQREVGDRELEGGTLFFIGAAHGRLGQSEQELGFYLQALTVARETGQRELEGSVLYNAGTVYSRLGQYPKALEFLEQALPAKREVGDRRGEGRTLNNLAGVYDHQGEYARALDLYEQAVAIARELRDRRDEGATLSNIGLLYAHLGDDLKALEFYAEALAIDREVGDRRSEAVTLHNIAGVYVRRGEYGRALELYQQALAIKREVGERRSEGPTLNAIGAVYLYLGQDDQALESFREAQVATLEVGDRVGEGVTLSNLAEVYRRLGEHTRAVESVRQALAIQRDAGDRPGEVVSLNNLGFLHESQGEFQRALEFYEQAIAIQESIRTSASLEEFKTGLASQSADVYERTVLLLMRLGRSAQAFELAERARARTFLDQLGNARLDLRTGADAPLAEQEQALRLEIAGLDRDLRRAQAQSSDRQLSAEQQAEAVRSLTTQLAAKQRGYQDLLTSLKRANPEYASLVSVDPLTLRQIQDILDQDTTLLAYFVTWDTSLAFVVTRDSFHAVELPARGQDIDAAIAEFRSFGSLSVATPPELAQLHAWLIAPVAARLTTPVVGIVPHGVLHYLPFAALTDGVRYFGDEHTLFSLPSASVFDFVRQKRKAGDGSLLAVAQGQAEGLPALRYADQEAHDIATLFDTQATVGPTATESALVGRASEHGILHVAAHGELNRARPLFSRIVLAPGGEDDGSLYVHEVYGLDLARADLVVLSACQTQLGAHSRGDDVVGLNRAFIYAGAPTVIASLWSIDDAATAELMRSFYGHLKQGMGKAEALRAAQSEIRAQARYRHPYYWAAFVLTGDPGAGAE